MRLHRFDIKNFMGITNGSFEWDDIVVLIGANNCGKSSVLLALTWFLSGSAIKDISLFRRHETDRGHAIQLVGYFDELTQQERAQSAVSGRMHGDEWILKKEYWCEAADNGEDRGGWRELLSSYSSKEVIQGWPQPDTSWNAFPQEFEPLIQQVPNRGVRPNNETREVLRQLVRANRPGWVEFTPPEWIPNPGGGGNWKSNANSIIPRAIYIRAVHEAADETTSKDASSYGRIINLIVERKLSQRPEFNALREKIEDVLSLFRPDPVNPNNQAEEIRTIQQRINEGLNAVIGGEAAIRTSEPDLRTLLLPSTSLIIRDKYHGIETAVGQQGHGLQRTLIMTLLQLLAEVRDEDEDGNVSRLTVLLVEEPELYLHPQMERKMRDALYRLAAQSNIQVICCTHSPVFLDVGEKHKAIVRLVKDNNGEIAFSQVTDELFQGQQDEQDRDRLKVVSRFHPTVNELFFAKRVVLFEEESAVVAFERAGEVTGLFARHPNSRRDVTLIDCKGKHNIPGFQTVLNRFCIPYTVIHDADEGNVAAQVNAKIAGLISLNANLFLIQPGDLEGLLGYVATRDKPYKALRRVEELHAAGELPGLFLEALNWIYFGAPQEPQLAP